VSAEEILRELEGRLRDPAIAAALREVDGAVELVLSGETWHVTLAAGRATIGGGASTSPDAILRMDTGDFAALLRGELRPGPAWIDGRLRISGDVAFAMGLGEALASVTSSPSERRASTASEPGP
jgi:putative sterol carrier protein